MSCEATRTLDLLIKWASQPYIRSIEQKVGFQGQTSKVEVVIYEVFRVFLCNLLRFTLENAFKTAILPVLKGISGI